MAMALEPCRECGRTISTEAVACPHCGAPPKPRQNLNMSSSPPATGKTGEGCAAFGIGCLVILALFVAMCAA